VPIVEIEKQIADIAAMAGMASGDVCRRDGRRSELRQIGDQLLDEREIGSQMNERR
jgi:hypothetical protein